MSESTKATKMPETKYYARFFTVSSFEAKDYLQEIATSDLSIAEWPNAAYAGMLMERKRLVLDGEVFLTDFRPAGPLTFRAGTEVMMSEQVEKDERATPDLLEKIKTFNWDRVAWTKPGNWVVPFEGDAVVMES